MVLGELVLDLFKGLAKPFQRRLGDSYPVILDHDVDRLLGGFGGD